MSAYRTRRLLRRIGLLYCALVLLAALGSIWTAFELRAGYTTLHVRHGNLLVRVVAAESRRGSNSTCGFDHVALKPDYLAKWPSFQKVSTLVNLVPPEGEWPEGVQAIVAYQLPYCVTWVAVVPFWVLFLVGAAPTGLLWYFGRRRIPPGHCQKCGYNLTGNVSGVCPEFGRAIVGTVREEKRAEKPGARIENP